MSIQLKIVILIGLLLASPLIVCGFPPVGDAVYHYQWQANFTRELFGGQYYPRWLLFANDGLGSADFLFYGPAAFYVGGLSSVFLENDVQAWRQLGVSCAISLLLSGLFAYLWLQKYGVATTAAIGAVLYMVFPYHLYVDLFVRGAYAEFWAFTWLPLILYASRDVAERNRSHILLALSYAALVFTHLPTTVIFSPVAFSYGVLCAERSGNKYRYLNIGFLGIAFIVGIALSSAYWYPAVALKKYTESVTEGQLNYSMNFIFGHSAEGFEEQLARMTRVTLAVIAMLAALVFLFAHERIVKKSRKFGSDTMFWLIVAMAAIFMTTVHSSFLWKAIPVIQNIQFPWRFHVLAVVAAVPVITKFLTNMSFNVRHISVFIAVSVCFGVAWGFPLSKSEYWDAMARFRLLTVSVEAKERQFESPYHVTKEFFSFLPIWAAAARTTLLSETTHDRIRSDAVVEVSKWESGDIRFQFESSEPSLVRVGQLYFPGWRAILEQSNEVLQVTPDPDLGIVTVQVPAGKGNVSLSLDDIPYVKAANVISLSALGLVISLVLVKRLKSYFPSVNGNKVDNEHGRLE